MDLGSIAFTLLSVIAAIAAIFLMALVKELRAQNESPSGRFNSFASRLDDPPAPSDAGSPGRRGRAPTPIDRDEAHRRIFNATMSLKVLEWLAKLGVPLRDRPDVRQEVLIAAHKSFPNYDPSRSRPERWLNKIAVYVAAHYHQLARHRREVLTPVDPRCILEAEAFVPVPDDSADPPSEPPGSITPALADITDPSPDAYDVIAGEQDRTMVMALLQSIDADIRAVLIAHDLDDVPMKEIAEQLEIPLSTAYKWHTRARAALRQAVEERLSADAERAELDPER